MKIAVVAYEMEGARTGVGRYLEGLLRGVAGLAAAQSTPADWRWRLYFKGDPFEHPLWAAGATQDPLFEPVFDRRPSARPILWEQLRLPRLLRRDGVDFVFSPGYSLPRVAAPAMVTMHDLSFEHLPEEFDVKERLRRRFLARRAVARARRALVDSTEIARDLQRTYGVDGGRVAVVPLGLDGGLRQRQAADPADDDARLRDCGVRPPFLVQLGTMLPRRNVDLVIAAFARLAADFPALQLVLAGRNRLRRPRQLQRWISDSGCAERIVELGYIPEDALLPLYRRAQLSVYLSSYEGYGLPPLESLAAGTPAIVGPGLALDDLWPDYPYRCEPLEADTVTAVLGAALEDSEARAAVAREAREHLSRLTWERSAALLVAEIERAAA